MSILFLGSTGSMLNYARNFFGKLNPERIQYYRRGLKESLYHLSPIDRFNRGSFKARTGNRAIFYRIQAVHKDRKSIEDERFIFTYPESKEFRIITSPKAEKEIDRLSNDLGIAVKEVLGAIVRYMFFDEESDTTRRLKDTFACEEKDVRPAYIVDARGVIEEIRPGYQEDVFIDVAGSVPYGGIFLGVGKKGFLTVVNELLDNARSHGDKTRDHKSVWFKMSADSKRLTIEVFNEGPAVDFETLSSKLITAAKEGRLFEDEDSVLWVWLSEAETKKRVRSEGAYRQVEEGEIRKTIRKSPEEMLFVGRLSSHPPDRPGGIGLTMVRKMVREAGGDVAYQPTLQGPEFVATLPIL